MLFRNLALLALAASVSAISSAQDSEDINQAVEIAHVPDNANFAESADAGETTIVLTMLSTSTNFITATDAATPSIKSPLFAMPTPTANSPRPDNSANPIGDTNILIPTDRVNTRPNLLPSPTPSVGFGLAHDTNPTKSSKCKPTGIFPRPGGGSASPVPSPVIPPYANTTLPDSGNPQPYPTATLPTIPGTTGLPMASGVPSNQEGTWIGSCDGPSKGGVKMLPDSVNCNVYWVCDHNKPRKMNCAPGTEFLASGHRCDFPRNGGCKAKGSSS
ncbi:hypothetical protein BZA77DRAFT_322981 [Pyronema omphalodes]|nr:hypothetical protein BZA77DRAFT_322981 [Pyronema omphalodes]